MSQLYFELSEVIAKESNLPRYITWKTEEANTLRQRIYYIADRVWAQNDEGIRYTKHRLENLNTAKVDIEEFMWVKLKSKSI
jgi:hypothetical protein